MARHGRTEPEVEALERSPSQLLHRALQFALDLYAEETGPGAPTQRQYAVLSAVAAREGLTQTELVRATGIDRSTLADLVARMIGKGLLTRERSAADGRANTVRLGERGRAALAEAAPRAAKADARILATLSKSKRDAFVSSLRALAKARDKALAKAERQASRAANDDGAAKSAKADKPKKPKKAKAAPAAEFRP
jgi:DNA-binding MarR family transcriptional regulator